MMLGTITRKQSLILRETLQPESQKCDLLLVKLNESSFHPLCSKCSAICANVV
jgi:hypothetical protein